MVQLRRIEIELVLGGEATEVGIFHDARHRFERGNHDPALDLGQLLQVLAFGLERVAVDLTAGAGDRSECGGGARGQRHLRDALEQPLPDPVVFVAIAKQHRDQGQAERAGGAHQQQPRRAIDLALEWHGDQLLDLLGGESRYLRGHLRGDITELRIRLDAERLPGVDAEDAEQQRDDDHRDAPVQAETDELVNH